jgi:hypothetical protein
VEQEAIGSVLTCPAILAELSDGMEVRERDIGPSTDVFDINEHRRHLASPSRVIGSPARQSSPPDVEVNPLNEA